MRNDNSARTRTFPEFLFTADESKSGTTSMDYHPCDTADQAGF